MISIISKFFQNTWKFSLQPLQIFAETLVGPGLYVQTMHIGPYATELATVERMQIFMQENGYRDRVGLGGKHHKIYLGDPRQADPSKLKTVLRHPVEKA